MTLEHLIQAYNFNRITNKIKEKYENTGVISFNDNGNINAAYMTDEENVIIAIKIFANCITKDRNINTQLEHTIEIIRIIQKTIELVCNENQKETNLILESLGLFDNTFKKGKNIKHLNYIYSVEIVDGLLMFSIQEEVNDE